jgi:hypothetical protein
LEIAHLPEAEKQKRICDKHRNYSDWLKEINARGFCANNQRGGQSPKQRGQSAREFAERAEQFGVGRRHQEIMRDELRMMKLNLRASNFSKRQSLFSEFARMVLRAVQDAEDDNIASGDAEKYFVRKAVRMVFRLWPAWAEMAFVVR